MPVVTGNLRDITNVAMVSEQPQIVFTLNQTNMAGGVLYPTEPAVVTPAADGSFSVNLAATQEMMDTGWYTLKLQWLGLSTGAALLDFPEWKITVPRSGGVISNLLSKPGTNQRIVWVSKTPPLMPKPFMLWLEQDPLQPGERDSARLYEWRRGGWSEHGNGSWAYIADLKGAPGYNATGAAEDMATIAAYILATAGPNPVSNAITDAVAARIPTLYVDALGAKGDGTADDTATLQQAFDMVGVVTKGRTHGIVSLRPGATYRVTQELVVSRNTTLEMNGSTIRRDHAGYLLMNGRRGSSYAGYAGHGNIQIRNGTLNHNAGSQPGMGSTICFGHADGITIDGVTVLDATSHGYEMNSSRNVVVRNCKFMGYRAPTPNTYVEAIQPDQATSWGFSAFGASDYTGTYRVRIENCYFGPSANYGAHPRGIGAHASIVDRPTYDMVISGCTFEDQISEAIRPYNWCDVVVENCYSTAQGGLALVNSVIPGDGTGSNTINGAGVQTGASVTSKGLAFRGNTSTRGQGIRLVGQTGGRIRQVSITGNSFIGDSLAGDLECIWGYQFDSVNILDNHIEGYKIGIGFYASVTDYRLTVMGNEIRYCGNHGMYIGGAEGLIISGNHTYNCGSKNEVGSHIRLSGTAKNGSITGNVGQTTGAEFKGVYGIYVASTVSGISNGGNSMVGAGTTGIADGSTGGSTYGNVS